MKLKIAFILLVLLVTGACEKKIHSYSFSGSAILKDKAVVIYDLEIFFKNDAGVMEIKQKVDVIKHALRIILIQRKSSQFDNSSRLKSVLNKVFKSQLNERVVGIKVVGFDVKNKM